ncbi:right-handed parallel beta-helix repeat-containing protein [uncultured Maribacter sp.]|uniref:right-handed parallel beta-helix repeat-containing protein n=1 Tax=uncultured Maribacter sp. TaxID=431308 RepID=UPI00261F86A3|nr:right-handed parallel beta-helix repeat-containing protein [uncultured Maribacter sp.]
MKVLFKLLILITGLSSCKSDAISMDVEPGIIENQTFNSTVLIDGHAYDGTIIRNCIFENIGGDGLQIRDVNNLCIENCIFRDIAEDAIRFRNSGSSNNVKIIDNQIHDIEENGILAAENHINTLIKGNTIYNVATNNTSSQFGAPHHGIYFQGFNVSITENTIYNVLNDGGNCISIRTYGVISKNKLYQATDHGISYFSDHPGDSGQLLIENNVIYDNGMRGINLASNGNSSNHIGHALVRFNTIVSDSKSSIGINDALIGVDFDIIGNIAIRTDGGTTFIYANLPYSESNNVIGSNDIGFIDFSNRDLHITNSSAATNAAVGLTDFPLTDFDGNTRDIASLDAGAYKN